MKLMKKLIAVACVLTMVFALTACSSGGKSGEDSLTIEKGKLIMSTNAEFPPYEMKADGEGAYKGYEGIDI